MASPAMKRAGLVYCGDYDPVGVDEYRELKKAVGDRMRIYVPDNLEGLLQRYGNRKLIQNSPDVLSMLRHSSDPTVRDLVDMMDRHGKGLEQEALLALG